MAITILGGGTAVKYNTPVFPNPTTLLYTDTTAKTIATIPANSLITEIFLNPVTAFNDSGTDTFDMGTTDTIDLFIDGYTIPAASDVIPPYHKTSLKNNMFITDETVVKAKYIGQNGDATQGAIKIYIHYVTFS